MNDEKNTMPEEKDLMQIDPEAGPGADAPPEALEGGNNGE